MRIFLIGFMGVGKTTCGKELSKKLNMNFLDTDEEIEKINNMTIKEIFTKYGEQHFRTLEHNYAKSMSSIQNAVIAVGGGFPIFNNNMDILNDLGTTVWLKGDANTILSNIGNDTTRPILQTEDKNQVINKLLNERKEFYSKSKFKVSVDGKSVNAVVDNIIAIIDYNIIK